MALRSLALLLLLGVSACVGDVPVVHEQTDASDPLKSNGTLDFVTRHAYPNIVHDCTPAQRAAIEAGWAIAMTYINGPGTQTLASCLSRTFTTHSDFSLVAAPTETEQVLAAMRANVPTQIECRAPEETVDGGVHAGSGSGEVLVADNTLFSYGPTGIAYRILRGLAQTWNLPGPTYDLGVTQEWNLRGCLHAIFVDGSSVPTNVYATTSSRATIATGTFLEPVGFNLGAIPEVRSCNASNPRGDGGFATGINAQLTTHAANVGLSCRNALTAETAISRWNTTNTGGATGTAYASSCALDELLVGVSGSTSPGGFHHLRALCEPRASIQANQDLTNPGTAIGPEGVGTAFERRCPTGSAVRAFRTRRDDAKVYALELLCQPVAALPRMTIRNVGDATYTVGTAATNRAAVECPPSMAMKGVYGQTSSAGLTRLGAVCGGMANANTPSVTSSGTSALTQSMGSMTAPSTSRSCPGNERVVGITVHRAPSGVLSGVVLQCADVAAWRTGAGRRYIPIFGTPSAVGGTGYVCGHGHFMNALLANQAPTDLNGLSLYCESFID